MRLVATVAPSCRLMTVLSGVFAAASVVFEAPVCMVAMECVSSKPAPLLHRGPKNVVEI